MPGGPKEKDDGKKAPGSDPQERRKFVRIRREVTVQIKRQTGDGALVAGKTLDVSLMGLRTQVAAELVTGTPVEIMFDEPTLALHVTVPGVVAWAAHEQSSHDVGVSLLGMLPLDQDNFLSIFGEGGGHERREYVRLQKRLVAEVPTGLAFLGGAMVVSTADIGLGGIAAVAPKPLKVGKRYQLKVFLRHEERPFLAQATAVACNPTPDGQHFVRMKFDGIVEDERKRLGRFLGAELTTGRK